MAAPLLAGEQLSTSDWLALEGDQFRYSELVDGTLLMVPPPRPRHQRVEASVERALAAAAPPPREVLHGIGVTISPDPRPTHRIPDVVVTHAQLPDDMVLATADQILLAVEIVSPGGRLRDHIHKKGEYELVGIPYYWVIDTEPFRLIAYRLQDGRYEQYLDASAAPVQLDEPFPVTLPPL